jgi:hypothetical protein
MSGMGVRARQTPRLSDAVCPTDEDVRRTRLARLSPRTRQLVEMLVRRPDLSIVDVARLIGLAESNARVRLHREVYPPSGLDCEGRGHLTVLYRDLVEVDPADDASTPCE